ncbi:urea carboxylase [Lyngbya sp. CCAP 1446/10]|uniref:urea carboxylase n=1 Tax=Lyngbya sp. CCAP 1446/10 TaxID=439293 RepID=UPI00223771E3|nr:urea carboxylase [Lyngbya sp. CCAP 1446/10]
MPNSQCPIPNSQFPIPPIMFNKVLIANRGEIACRIIRTLDRLGIASVAVYSEADARAQHVFTASEAVCIGAAAAAESYLRFDRILEVARQTKAQAIHPGYGFLSENAEFAEACISENIAFIGPTPAQLRCFGLKHTAREIAAANQVPLTPGSELLASLEDAERAAGAIGYPVMLKSTAGGGGIGLQACFGDRDLAEAFEKVQRLSQSNFKQSGVFLEKYIQTARHIEVQIFGDGKGNVIALGERDCSVQRRHQKVIEETPAPAITDEQRNQLYGAAVRLGKAVNYQSAGTVEFVFDVDAKQFYFLEVNTRLQVEHGVTEAVNNIDLVEWMVKQASGDLFPIQNYQYQPQGHSIEVRIYAEDAAKNFHPSSGLLNLVAFPENVRCDSWIETGTEVTPFYDPLLAKVIVCGENRAQAIAQLKAALDASKIAGIETNLDYLRQILDDSRFNRGELSTRFLNSFEYAPLTIDVLDGGTYSSIQDYPGRIGYWDVGVPPSGPMDHLAFRSANRLVGNPESTAGLEFTATGPTLRFNADTVISLTGATMKGTLNGESVQFWRAIPVKAGSILKLKAIEGGGYRTYLAVKHGFNVPEYLGSKSTFVLGKFGGHAGRTLRPGDVLKLHQTATLEAELSLPSELIPTYSNNWEIGVLYGPHGAPDFFTEEDIEMFFSTEWRVHYNSTRTGIRLIGPKPTWARQDGGEAGLHPSNIHDNAYAIGTIDFTGDMPVILGLDGPSLGGFVCPATIVQSQLWKIGQLKPGDSIRFYCLSFAEALQQELEQERQISTFCLPVSDEKSEGLFQLLGSPVLHKISESSGQVAVTYRQAGDKYILVEYGPLVLDLNLRFRAHSLMAWLTANPLPGVIELVPGMRSLQIHFESRQISQQQLMQALIAAETELPAIENMEVPARIVHLPLSWEDESTLLAIEKYMQSVRSDAPWCPSNIEFIRRINGLDSIEQVREIVFNASYLVMGLGDVYLGAPVATPLDPRHRLVTTKYNPARTWTPENAVGIGGAYLCVYGMEGPGGYQFVGRTVQMWNRFKQTADFQSGKPWLLRFFDQIRFYPVSHEELLRCREEFIEGKFQLKVEEITFKLREYNEFLHSIASSAAEFKANQQAAFNAERDRWAAAGEFDSESVAEASVDMLAEAAADVALPAGCEAVVAHVSANVWQVLVNIGDAVAEGDRLLILEAMKMEIAITADVAGTVAELFCQQGQTVTAGQILAAVQPD